MRVISRGVVLGFMVAVLLPAAPQVAAQADACVSVRSVDTVGSECRSEVTSLTIGVTDTGPLDSPFLQRGDVVDDSTRVTQGEDGLLGIAVAPDFDF